LGGGEGEDETGKVSTNEPEEDPGQYTEHMKAKLQSILVLLFGTMSE